MSTSDITYKSAVLVPRSGNQWVDGLTDGYRWGITQDDPTIGYTFISDTSGLPSGEFGGYPSWGWNEAERLRMEQSMNAIESACALNFLDRGNDNDDNVELWFYSLDQSSSVDAYGFAYTPGSDADEGLVAINWSFYRSEDGRFEHSIEPGSFYGITFLHELSHAVGLKHPHDRGLFRQPRFPGLTFRSDEFTDKGRFDQNAHPYTQLSYVDIGARNGLLPTSDADYGFLQALGALDIAALQWIYGINPTSASDDDVYRLPLSNQQGTGWHAIWDTGGRDRIVGAKASSPVTIDLRNATLGDDSFAGGYVSRVDGIQGGFTISHDWNGQDFGVPAGLCVIEDATGGKGDDLLIGNAASNRLKGKKGDDILYAGAGSRNKLIGGKGRDKFLIDSDEGTFVVIKDFHRQKDRLVFDIPSESVLLQETGKNSEIFVEDRLVAKVLKETQIDQTQSILFENFDAFGI